MLVIPKDSPSLVSVIGIDPGSETLGLAVLTYDLQTKLIVGCKANTYVGSKLRYNSPWIEEIHGARTARIKAHEENLVNIFKIERPVAIACESPFFNQRRPQAYGALTEVATAIRNAVLEYNEWLRLYFYDPPTVKRAVKAAGNALKDEVKAKVKQLDNLNYNGDKPLDSLDEHSIDSIAVAYCHYLKMRE